MKRIISTLLLLSVFGIAFSQSPRLVLWEQFTQASCPPCADVNPDISAWVHANPGKIVKVNYQVWWPGFDPMYNEYPDAANERSGVYSINSVPTTVVDGGEVWNGSSFTFIAGADGYINNRLNTPSPFDIDLETEFLPDGKSIGINVHVEASMATSGAKRIFVGLVEKNIVYPNPPGTNGESHFENVIKQLLPSPLGEVISSNWVTGDSEDYSFSWEIENIRDLREMAVVAWIQGDVFDKEVYQAAEKMIDFPVNMSLDLSGSDPFMFVGNNGSGDFFPVFNFGATGDETYILELDKSDLPAGWDAEFSFQGNTLSGSGSFILSNSGTEYPVVTLNSGSTSMEKGSVKLKVSSLSAPGFSREVELTAYSFVTNLVLESDGPNTILQDALSASSHDYISIPSSQFEDFAPASINKANVSHVFYSQNEIQSPPSNISLSNQFKSYLNNDGNLFIGGEDIAEYYDGAGTSEKMLFLQSFGGVFENGGGDAGHTISGVSGEPVFNSFTGQLNTATAQLSSDVISLSPLGENATTCFVYDNDPTLVGGIRNFGTSTPWKTVFLSFRWEQLEEAARNELIDKSIQWFDGMVSTKSPITEGLIKAFPNPTSDIITLDFPSLLSSSKVRVMDVRGIVILETKVEAGKTNMTLSMKDFDSGIYFIRIDGLDSVSKFIKK